MQGLAPRPALCTPGSPPPPPPPTLAAAPAPQVRKQPRPAVEMRMRGGRGITWRLEGRRQRGKAAERRRVARVRTSPAHCEAPPPSAGTRLLLPPFACRSRWPQTPTWSKPGLAGWSSFVFCLRVLACRVFNFCGAGRTASYQSWGS